MRVKLSDKAVKRIAKKVEGQWNPQDIDETLEMDEAHAEFMKAEEEGGYQGIDTLIFNIEDFSSIKIWQDLLIALGVDIYATEDIIEEVHIEVGNATAPQGRPGGGPRSK